MLRCNIRSVFPSIDIQECMAIFNSVITPAPSIVANCVITILWSHTWKEVEVRIVNNNSWSPNHFVPLMLLTDQNEISQSSQSKLTLVVSYMYVNQSLKSLKFI